MSLQRSLQNGRQGKEVSHSKGFPQFGHFTRVGFFFTGSREKRLKDTGIQREGDVFLRLCGAINLEGSQEPYGEPVFAAADFREKRRALGQTNLNQLDRCLGIEVALKKTAKRLFPCRSRAATDQGEYQRNRMLYGIQGRQPGTEFRLAGLVRLFQPIVVEREIEGATAAGDTVSLQNIFEKLV